MSGWSTAFSPCQITGFFRIHDRSGNFRRVGSTGAGVCIQQGVTTSVKLLQRSTRHDILFNGHLLSNPNVSRLVLREFQHVSGRFNATVKHQSELPVGCGYGTSGAGALSLALSLNESLGEPVSRVEAARIAHTSEVEARTGLGTVVAEYAGGVVVRLKPGAPGVGAIKRLRFRKNLRVVSGTFGPFRKSKVLGNMRISERVNMCGRNLVSRFIKQPREAAFMELSRTFSACVSLSSPRLKTATRRVEAEGFLPSMMMLGESLFCLVDSEDVERTGEALMKTGMSPVVSGISYRGARLQ